MKKTSFIVLSLVLAIAMMGAGYAAWQSTLAVNNTVNTGTFGFAFNSSVPAVQGTNDSYITTKTATATSAAGQITLENLYPGVTETVHFPIINSSSIPATISNYNLSGLPVGLTVQENAIVGAVSTSLDGSAFSIPANTNFTLEYVFTADNNLSKDGNNYSTPVTLQFDQAAEQ